MRPWRVVDVAEEILQMVFEELMFCACYGVGQLVIDGAEIREIAHNRLGSAMVGEQYHANVCATLSGMNEPSDHHGLITVMKVGWEESGLRRTGD